MELTYLLIYNIFAEIEMDRYTWGKWLIHSPKHIKGNQSQSSKQPCKNNLIRLVNAIQGSYATIVQSGIPKEGSGTETSLGGM